MISQKEISPDPRLLEAKFKERATKLSPCVPFVRAFASKRYENTVLLAGLDCGCWECRKCGPKKKSEWFLRHLNLWLDEPYLERIVINKDDWGKYHRMFNRKKGKFIRYTMESGKYQIVTDLKLGGITIGRRKRKEVLLKIMNYVSYSKRPISQSRNWNELRKPPKETNWKALDRLEARYSTLAACGKRLDELKQQYPLAWNEQNVSTAFTKSLVGIIFTVQNSEDYMNVLWGMSIMMRSRDDSRRAPPQKKVA